MGKRQALIPIELIYSLTYICCAEYIREPIVGGQQHLSAHREQEEQQSVDVHQIHSCRFPNLDCSDCFEELDEVMTGEEALEVPSHELLCLGQGCVMDELVVGVLDRDSDVARV